jgi:ribonuclease P protein subunit POP4
MKVNTSNVLYHNLVGLEVRVASSTDPTQIGVEGRVIDETAKTLLISTTEGDKLIPKRISKFTFYIPNEVSIDGKTIAFSSEERLKRLQRRRY